MLLFGRDLELLEVSCSTARKETKEIIPDWRLFNIDHIRKEVSKMLNYDIRKDDHKWQFLKEDSDGPIKTFETKRDAIKYSREYLTTHGGHLRVWKADGSQIQEERSYEGEKQSFYTGVLENVDDTVKVAGTYLSKGVYGVGYYAAYGVVFGAMMIARLIPFPESLTHGVEDGTEAALESVEGTHHPHKNVTST
jgi:hypothetical protein